MRTFFTSDWHLWHTNIIKYANRPFKDSEEMNKVILDNFFETVDSGDTVYFLGDFAFSNKERLAEIIDVLTKINDYVTFHFILGNHDYKIRELFEQHCASVSTLKVVEVNDQKITLCHFPMHSFSGSHHNNWQLYGHHHSDTNKEILGKRYNVCLEANDYKPILFEKLQEIMQKREDNWDYISPEIRKREKHIEKLERNLAKAEQGLIALQSKMTKEFLENAPEKIVNSMKKKISHQEKEIQGIKGELKQYK